MNHGPVLILAEKPSAARNFAKALGGMEGTFDGTDYAIVPLRGHVLEFKMPADQVPEALSERYRVWSLDTLPWNPQDMAFVKCPRGDVEDVLAKLKDVAAGASEVAIATDLDPSGEGELLAWEALEWIGWSGRTARMRFVDEGQETVRKSFRERAIIPSMQRDGDFVKADARSKWDFLSMQFTRIASCVARQRGYRTVIRQGRLKSVMVYLVGQQLDLVKAYVKKPYFEARFKDEYGVVYSRDAESAQRFDTADEVDMSKLSESVAIEDGRTRKRKSPPPLLDLMGMASILATYGLDSGRVLTVYQKMYEDQVVSYPRTEDKTITNEQFAEMLPLIDAIADVVGIDKALLTHRTARKGHVKDQGAHGANRPGLNVPSSLDDLGSYGKEAPIIYKLLAKNFLAMFAEDYEYEQVRGHVRDYPDFKGQANIPLSPGFRAVLDSESLLDEEEGEVSVQGLGGVATPFVYEGANKKPQRPTMKWLKAKLEKYAVGTGATRVSTLDEIKVAGDARALLSEKKGVLDLTECGSISYKLLDGCDIASPEVTERLFADMDAIGRFELEPADIINQVAAHVMHDKERMLANAAKLGDLKIVGKQVVGKCPQCGSDVIATPKTFRCSSNKYEKREDGSFALTSGCGFTMWNTIAHKKITPKQAKSILAGKKVPIKGLKSKSGSTFEARVFLSDIAGKLEFDFEKRKR